MKEDKPVRYLILYPNGKTRSIESYYNFKSKTGKIIGKWSTSTGKTL